MEGPKDTDPKHSVKWNGSSPITKPNFDEQAASSETLVGEYERPMIMTTPGPAASISTTNILSVVVQCLKDLSQLVLKGLSSFASEVPPPLWKDELGRLRVWTVNIGAHQTGESSLDYRLRDTSHIKEQTLRVLQRLQRITQDINDVLHHSPEDDDFSDISGDEDDDEHQTEIQSIYHALRDTINNLFQKSMVIQKPARHDRLLGAKRSDAVLYEPFDRQHVTEKYPQAGEDVLNRLGLAISQRRAVMRYRERHRTKLGRGLSQVIEDQADRQSVILSDTVATEFMEGLPAAKDDLELLTVASQTSYAQTILNGPEGTVLPTRLMELHLNVPIVSRRAWARHVFNDLMPYLCIFPDCPTPHRLYESRRE
ncbi:Zinc finger C2H2 [Penicillium concentricum]|uniref:Zinc finger C2H2 n=1 Tax=Penicillium concentricum TaxID=293559 RepID=A0A9X0B297_9EURO|nr:Zinc finger C2H2 [Penicillium concentricum]KAJ5385563.1 Zinc finger C2H2 [Penicillium concentricum]